VTEPDNTTSPFARRGFIAAAVVVALVIVAAVVVIFTGGDDGDEVPVGVGGPATAPATSASADSGECDQPEGSQTPPVAAPVNEWELVGKLVAPTDPDGAGPGQVSDDGLRTCFAHDPTGALFAAVNWVATTTDPALVGPATEQLTAPGPGRDVILGALQNGPAEVIGDDPGGFQVTGFSFLTYTGDVAMINLAIALVGSGQASFPVTLEWSGDDWLMQIPADGNFGTGIQELPSLTGYVPWSGA
jgi:hypothetical protein